MTGKVVFVVEGPSDKAFWASVLHQAFSGRRGDFVVRVMHNRPKLIAAAWDWVDRVRAPGGRARSSCWTSTTTHASQDCSDDSTRA